MTSEQTLLRRLIPVAEEHGGLVSVAEAERAGVSNRMLLHYATTGDLERMQRGIYRLVWFPHHRFADVIAACLKVEDSVACGETAAAVWGLGDAMPSQITVCRDRTWRGAISGVRVVTCPLADDERTSRDSVPVTTLGRTLADIAASDPRRAREAIVVAQGNGILARRQLRGLTERYPALATVESVPERS